MSDWNINPETLLTMPGKIWVFWKDLQSTFMGCNDFMAEEIKLSSRSQIKGKKDSEIFKNPDEINHYVRCDKEVISVKRPTQFDDNITLADTIKKAICIKSPLIENSGKIIGVVGITYYLTNEKTTLTQFLKNKPESQLVLKNTTLTLRETQVMHYLLKGKSAKITADLLGISSRTIEYYLENIKAKLSVKSKTELIELALKHLE